MAEKMTPQEVVDAVRQDMKDNPGSVIDFAGKVRTVGEKPGGTHTARTMWALGTRTTISIGSGESGSTRTVRIDQGAKGTEVTYTAPDGTGRTVTSHDNDRADEMWRRFSLRIHRS